MDCKGWKFIDLFCGIGGFRLALESCGMKCVFSSEINEKAADTYEMNFGDRPAGDIRQVRNEDIPDHDLLCGGFPCQAFSLAGDQKGFDDPVRGTLVFEIIRIAKGKRPSVLLLENVKNYQAHDNGRTLLTTLERLRDAGYDPHWKVISSSGYGVPTNRERTYFVCFRSDLGVKFDFPPPPSICSSLRDVLLPDDQTGSYLFDRDDFVFRTENPEAQQSLFPGRVPQRPVRIGEVKDYGCHQGYRIYSADGHAITFSHMSGGAFADTGAYLINGRVRKLAPRECFRCMGFPDSYKMPEVEKQAWMQIGNSVVVPVVRALGEAIVKAMESI